MAADARAYQGKEFRDQRLDPGKPELGVWMIRHDNYAVAHPSDARDVNRQANYLSHDVGLPFAAERHRPLMN